MSGIVPKKSSELIESPLGTITTGQWYWVTRENAELFCCVTHVGSNFAEMTSVASESFRVHFSEFDSTCRLDSSPENHIKAQIALYQSKSKELTSQINSLARRLSVSSQKTEDHGIEALAHVNSNADVKSYERELVLAKEETFPELFSNLKETHESLAQWMSAESLALQAQASGLESILNGVKNQIHNIQLYSGLTENLAKLRSGHPASIDDRVHLMQRRCYMDEESLVAYQAGGMDFKDLAKFDAWISKSENFSRILPFPRCIVSFRIRRDRKYREVTSLLDFIRLPMLEQLDKLTFLYIRNGDQLFRMDTDIDFGEKLFPDMDRSKLSGKLWGKVFGDDIRDVISDDEYQARVAEESAELKAWKKARKNKATRNTTSSCPPWSDMDRYIPYSPDNVHFDDFRAKIQADINHHNRVVIILQGLLDRSIALHPHHDYKLWSPEGFDSAIKLVYDDDRALAPADLPDFEAYRERLNQNLQKGSITVGQENIWARVEAERLRRSQCGFNRETFSPELYHPYGNPGPGFLAQVFRYSPVKETCSYSWERRRQHYVAGKSDMLPAALTVNAKAILNVSSYTPGDFKQFYADPRTRIDYLKWAPLLLAAEDYHAGFRKVGDAREW